MTDVQEVVVLPKEFNDFMCAFRDLGIAIFQGKLDLSAEVGVAIKLAGEFQALPPELKNEPIRCAESAELRITEFVKEVLGVVEPL